MWSGIKNAIDVLKKKIKAAQVNYFTIALKNPELDKEFVEQDRRLVKERAKVHLIFAVFLLLLSPFYISSGLQTFTYILGLAMATIISVGVCLFTSRFRLAAIEFILILTPTTRAIVKFITHKTSHDLTCMPKSFQGVLVYAEVGLFVMESIICRRGCLSYASGCLLFLVG